MDYREKELAETFCSLKLCVSVYSVVKIHKIIRILYEEPVSLDI
jgi:hypothetical protein